MPQEFPESAVEAAVRDATARLRFERDRFDWQARFARILANRLTPGAGAEWNPLIERAEKQVLRWAARGDARALAEAVDEAESILAPLAKEAKRRVVHMVAHSHIDMNWQWSWQETVAATCDTFGTVLKIMAQFPDLVFTQSQCSCYRICEEYEPELIPRIASHVKSGRWESVASSWVEGDRNLAGGESLARHLLESRRYMRDLFGLAPEDIPIDWSPDTFGFAATTPTWLALGGVRFVYLHRPGGRTNPKHGLFWWAGPDGARVLTRNDMRHGYLGAPEPRKIVRALAEMEAECRLPAAMVLYGFGDHGGAPNVRHARMIEAMRRWPVFPEVRFSSARAFFETAQRLAGDRIPEITGELNPEFTGCYTSQSVIKRCNRFAEKRLLDAETALVAAEALAGHAGNRDLLRACWRNTLFTHFHDILPGSGVHDTRAYAHGQFQNTMAATSREETRALRALAERINTSAVAASEPRAESPNPAEDETGFGAGAGVGVADGSISQADGTDGRGGRVCVAFNPTGSDRNEVVEMLVWDDLFSRLGQPGARPPFSVADADGRVVAAQAIDYREQWGHHGARVAFPVRVPAMGWTTVAIRETEAPDPAGVARPIDPPYHCGYATRERAPLGLENERARVEFDSRTGGIVRFSDKTSGATPIDVRDGRARDPLEFYIERVRSMTAWHVGYEGQTEPVRVTGVKTPLRGPHKASIEFSLSVRESALTLAYELRAGDPTLHMRISGTWVERGSAQTGVPALRAVFPAAMSDAELRCEAPFGAISRDLAGGEEEPALRWASLSGAGADGKRIGLLLMNDSKHGHSVLDGTLRLSLIRSSYDPDPLPEIGEHDIRLALRPFAGRMSDAEATRWAEGFEREVKLIQTTAHPGDLPAETGLISVAPEGRVVLGSVKRAEEDPRALMLRLYTTEPRPVEVRVRFDTGLLGRPVSAEFTDMMERPIRPAGGSVSAAGGVLRARVPAGGIANLRVTLERNERGAAGGRKRRVQGRPA